MGFNPPVPQQDSNWEIRLAVLLSLLLQVLLVFAGPRRKRTSSRVACFAIWSCYLLADWVADLALGLLLNNMGNIGGSRPGGSSSSSTSGVSCHTSTDSSSPVIFAFWTPFLLLHLGGQDTITAYSIEDNELWLRHLVGFLFELFSAAVIFFCSLQGNYHPMILATVLMFVVGIIKYGERTYSLYSSSVYGVLAKILRDRDPDPGPNYAKLMTEFDAKEKAGLVAEIVIANGDAKKALDEQEQYRQNQLVKRSTIKSLEAQAYELFFILWRVSYDVTLSYEERKTSQDYFRPLKPTEAFEVIEMELNFLYDMVHTKAPVAHTKAGLALRFVGSGCLVSALAIFFLLDKRGSIQRVDVGITYALLLGGLALDAAALSVLLCSSWTLVFLEETPRLAWLARAIRLLRCRLRHRRWSETTSHLNLISYCLGKPDGKDDEGGGFANPRVTRALPCFAKVAEKLRVREIFDDFFFIRRERLSCRKQQGEESLLLKFIFKKLREAAKKAKGVKYMSNYRGEGVLVHDLNKDIELKLKEATRGEQRDLDEAELAKKTKEKLDGVLVGSLKKDFDESLLLWHIATDLCLLPLPDPGYCFPESQMKLIGKTLSEYMLYLLFKQPEMLSATAGIGLLRYRDTCAEARRFFRSADAWDPDHDDARTMLLSVNTSKKPSEVKGKGNRSMSVLFDACILAKVLRELGGDLMWEVVTSVWWEMLTYAARKCKGSTHVQQLSRGGELMTIIWFLMAHMGIGDMYQIQEGDATAKLIVHDQ